VRRLPDKQVDAAPRVLGVDDFALKKGHVYGTIILDMETGERVDVLPDRTADTLAAWLRAHPGAEIVCRDRASAYAEAVRTACPDAGKKTPGRKRHVIVDLKGLPLFVMVTPADMHDSIAAREALFRLRLMHPEITIVWADLAYAGTLVAWAKSFLRLTVKTVSRPKGAQGFMILPLCLPETSSMQVRVCLGGRVLARLVVAPA
jgi:transposase